MTQLLSAVNCLEPRLIKPHIPLILERVQDKFGLMMWNALDQNRIWSNVLAWTWVLIIVVTMKTPASSATVS